MPLDAAQSLPDVWFRLGFSSNADMTAATSWLTSAELYQWADDAVKVLARNTAVFLDYNAATAVTATDSTYALPAGHIFTESAWLIYPTRVQGLRLTTAQELFALDSVWPNTAGGPKRLSLDAADAQTGMLYPEPNQDSTLALVSEICPATVAAGASTIPCSAVLQDWISYAMIAGALSKESDSARREIAAHAQKRVDLYASIARQLWGPAV